MAVDHLRRAAAHNGDNLWFQLNYGRAALRCGCYREALAAFQRISGSKAAAGRDWLREAEKSLGQISRSTMALARRAIADLAFEDGFEYLAIAEAVTADQTETTDLRARLQRRMYSHVSALFRDQPDAAIGAIAAFVKLFPDNHKGLVMHGRSAMKHRDYAAALQSWQRAAQIAPDNAHYQLQMARCLSWLKRPEACEAANRALQLDPGLEEARQIVDQFVAAQN